MSMQAEGVANTKALGKFGQGALRTMWGMQGREGNRR